MERNCQVTQVAYPQAKEFVAAIAKPFDGKDFGVVAKALGISWADINGGDPELQVHEMSLSSLGLQLTFEDEGVVLEKEYHDPGDGPFILTICTFWGYEESLEKYEGPLWEGIVFDDSLEDVEKKIGKPTKINTRDSIYFWEYGDFRLTIQWAEEKKIRGVAYWMKQG